MNISGALIQKLMVPIVVFLGLLLLIVFGGRFLIGRIAGLRGELALVRAEESKLSGKLSLLNDFELTGQKLVRDVANAIPADNPSILAISQIRSTAGAYGLFVSQLSAGKTIAGEGLNHVDISFDVEGTVASTISFLNQLKKTAPFGTINKVTMGASGETVSSTVVYRVYYSASPESIPDIAQEIPPLTDEDMQIINMLSDLLSPNFVEILPEPAVVNGNPFGL